MSITAMGDRPRDRREAAEALVDLVADRLDLAPGAAVCDIGCGYGATAMTSRNDTASDVTGITSRRPQAAVARGSGRAPARSRSVSGDWLANGSPDASFDRAYAIESSEHMADKARFFARGVPRAAARRPALRLRLARARGRPRWEVRHLLEPICREGRLPGIGTAAEYRGLAAEAGFRVARLDDISGRVRRTWTICARRLAAKIATDSAYRRYLLDGRPRNRSFALSLARLAAAYRTGALRYGVLVADKPH